MIMLTPLLFVIFTFLVELKGNLYETSLQEGGVLFILISMVIIGAQIVFYMCFRDKNKASIVGTLFAFMFLSF